MRAVERRAGPRDAAICQLALNAGLRVSELHRLDVDDVAVSARLGQVDVRASKAGSGRQIPLNAEARQAVQAWLAARPEQAGAGDTPALYVAQRGGRLSTRGISRVVRKLGDEAGLEEVSVHVLRHTCLTRLVRSGTDLVTVAEIAGHRRLSTTRRYTLPSQADRQAAMEAVHVDY